MINNRFLFRGKLRDSYKWAYGGLVDKSKLVVKAKPSDVPQNARHGVDLHLAYVYVDPTTVGQCTGHTAAKSYRGERPEDRLIFEGDIVKINNLIYKVIWEDTQYKFEIISDTTYCYPYFCSNAPSCEIIGTIHDNPELLEGK